MGVDKTPGDLVLGVECWPKDIGSRSYTFVPRIDVSSISGSWPRISRAPSVMSKRITSWAGSPQTGRCGSRLAVWKLACGNDARR